MTSSKIPFVDIVAQHRPLRDELLEAVGKVLDHGQFILGPEVAEFEQQLGNYIGAKHVVGVNSGTDALVLALRLRNVGPGDEVITVAHSFVATATAVALVGATPVFVDLDLETMLMDAAQLESARSERTKAVICVHLNGHPCDLDAIGQFCDTHGLALIEDCAQAIGATYDGQGIGTRGIGCFSLHPLKMLSACGDGGAISVQSDDDAQRLKRLRNIGLVDRDHCHESAGNSRLDTIQAAMLLVKLKHFEQWLDAHRAHADAYREALKGVVALQRIHDKAIPSDSMFAIRVPDREHVLTQLKEAGVDAKVHYPVAIHQQQAFAKLPKANLPITEQVVREIISLPVKPELSVDQRNVVIDCLQKIVS